MAAKNRTGDWIAVLEASYSLDGDDPAWLGGLLDCIAREHWRERIAAAFTFDMSPTGPNVRDVRVHGPPEVREVLNATMKAASAEGIDRTFRAGQVVGTISELVFAQIPNDEAMFRKTNA